MSVSWLGTKVTAQDRAELHKEMLSRIEILEGVMAHLGHAWPPITEEDLIHIKSAIATLKAQPVGPISIPEAIKAMAKKSELERIASKLLENKQALRWELARLYIHLTRLAQSVSNWLHS